MPKAKGGKSYRIPEKRGKITPTLADLVKSQTRGMRLKSSNARQCLAFAETTHNPTTPDRGLAVPQTLLMWQVTKPAVGTTDRCSAGISQRVK